MVNKSLLRQIILDNVAQEFADLKPREQHLPTHLDRIISLTGARRSGKTSLLLHTIHTLRQELRPEQTLYLNFEDDRLFDLKVHDLDTIPESYYALFPAQQGSDSYFFFDEVQRVTGWETFVRRIQDTLPVKVFVTGSSASLLGREIATALRGRTLTYEVFPLSFAEYLAWHGLPIQPGTSAENQKIQYGYSRFFDTTAFPELIHWKERERIMALQEYIDLIIYRDVADRLKLTNTQVLKYLIQFLLANTGNLFSVNGIYRDLKGQGLSTSKDTVFEYMDLLEDAYAIFTVPIYSRNLKVRQRNLKKLYILDHGLKAATGQSKDRGAILEQIVFLDLRRRHRDIFYWREKQEVDFIVPTIDQVQAINVCLDMQDTQTRQREVAGMISCLEALNLVHGTIVTQYEEQILENKGRRIWVVPAWKWLLRQG